jgi:hypothetical protein
MGKQVKSNRHPDSRNRALPDKAQRWLHVEHLLEPPGHARDGLAALGAAFNPGVTAIVKERRGLFGVEFRPNECEFHSRVRRYQFSA